MLGVTEVTIFAADESEDDETTFLIEGEAVFEGDITMPFSAEYYIEDEDLDEVELEDTLIDTYDEEEFKDRTIESILEFIEE